MTETTVIIGTKYNNGRIAVTCDGLKNSIDAAVKYAADAIHCHRNTEVVLVNEAGDTCPLDHDVFILGDYNAKYAIRQFAKGERVTGAIVLNGKYYPVIKAKVKTAREKFLDAKKQIKTAPDKVLDNGNFTYKWLVIDERGNWNRTSKRNAAAIMHTFGLTLDTYIFLQEKWVAEEISRTALDIAAEEFAKSVIAPPKFLALPAPAEVTTEETTTEETTLAVLQAEYEDITAEMHDDNTTDARWERLRKYRADLRKVINAIKSKSTVTPAEEPTTGETTTGETTTGETTTGETTTEETTTEADSTYSLIEKEFDNPQEVAQNFIAVAAIFANAPADESAADEVTMTESTANFAEDTIQAMGTSAAIFANEIVDTAAQGHDVKYIATQITYPTGNEGEPTREVTKVFDTLREAVKFIFEENPIFTTETGCITFVYDDYYHGGIYDAGWRIKATNGKLLGYGDATDNYFDDDECAALWNEAFDEINNPKTRKPEGDTPPDDVTPPDTLQSVADTCATINATAPDGWEVRFDTSTNTYPIEHNGRVITTLDSLALAKALPPEKFFAQFDNGLTPKEQFLDDRRKELDLLNEMRPTVVDDPVRLSTLDRMIDEVKRAILDATLSDDDDRPPEKPVIDDNGEIWF